MGIVPCAVKDRPRYAEIYFQCGVKPTTKLRQQKMLLQWTVIRLVLISAKFGICTVVGLNGTVIEAKIGTWIGTLACAYFSFNKCLIKTHDGSNVQFNTN